MGRCLAYRVVRSVERILVGVPNELNDLLLIPIDDGDPTQHGGEQKAPGDGGLHFRKLN